MGHAYLEAVTPLLAVFWVWMLLLLFWTVASLFAAKTRSREPFLRRMQHQVLLGIAFYLIFTRHREFFLFGEIYRTHWDNWIVYLGFAFVFAGFAIAVWARITLGRYWSGVITFKEGHKVIDTGPYALVRHPIYTGWFLMMLGSAIVAGTLDAFAGVELLLLAFLIKLHREERLLTTELGDEYRKYMAKVPSALIPGLSAVGSSRDETIQSDAFNQAALKSDRYRATGLLCIFGFFAIFDIVSYLFGAGRQPGFFTHALAYWAWLAVYEGILLAITLQAQRTGRRVRPWVWIFNTIIESLLPTMALLGLTAAKDYLGPYRALVSSTVFTYTLFIILSTLRLSPGLCILSGFASAAGYIGLYFFTLHVAPNDAHRHFMPDQTYFNYALFLCLAGMVAAAVARQIRRHLIAALQEAETRRKLDRIEFDLKIARSIQMGLLPKSAPKVEGYDIAGWSEPADQTGGDYYDWIELPSGRVLVTIADAAGHGIGPALLVAACRAYFRAIATRDDPLECITAQVDALLAADVPAGRFITAAIALLDPKANELSLYSAGHAPLYLYKAADQRVETYDADQPPLGTQSGPGESHARQIPMSPGDALVLVTDGFFECTSATGQMLGMDRLGDAIGGNQTDGADHLIRRLCENVHDFAKGVPQADDLTVVVIKRNRQ